VGLHGSQTWHARLPDAFLSSEGLQKLATEDERIAELVEMIAHANGTNQAIALTRELNALLEARKERHNGNPPARETF